MDKQDILTIAINDVKESIKRIEAKQEMLSDEKVIKAIKEFDDFDVILRKFWLF